MAPTTLDDSPPRRDAEPAGGDDQVAVVESARHRRRGRQALLFAAPVVLLELGAWSHRWVTEDAFIYFRIVDNVFAGNGPVFNAGERVEAGTGTIWTALLAVGRLLFGWFAPVEWIAVVLGLALTGVAVVLAQSGAARLARSRRPDAGLIWPAAILVVVALPSMWDFATSGLESSLEFAWLAAVFWALTHRATGRERLRPQSPWWLAVLIGLGPLVRPDLAIFTVVFLFALLAVSAGGWRGRFIALAEAAAIPVVWELFRMGYYGALVPNTAIAKSAGSSNWPQGWRYLVDFATPYRVAVPVVLCVVLAAAVARGSAPSRDRLIVTIAPVIGAAVSVVYVTRLGGDFMHARFWLPAAFAAVLPISALPVPSLRSWRGAATAVAIAGLCAWGLLASRVAVPYARDISADGIADERGFWERAAGRDNPVTMEDFGSSFLVTDAQRDRHEADAIGPDSIVIDLGGPRTKAAAPAGTGDHLAYRNIGVYGVEAGLATTVMDPHGLSDPLAARLELAPDGRERPGHEKNLPEVWILARHAAPSERDSAELRAARHALQCGDLAEVLAASNEPLSVGRFVSNLTGSVHRMRVVVPADPLAAEAKFCG